MRNSSVLLLVGAAAIGGSTLFVACVEQGTGGGGSGAMGGAGAGGTAGMAGMAGSAGTGGGSAGSAGMGGVNYPACTDPYPAQVPADWTWVEGWNCECPLFYAPNPDTQVDPIEWVDCPSLPWPGDCRMMNASWAVDDFATNKFAWVAEDPGGTPVLAFRRNLADAYEEVVAEVDGPAVFGWLRPKAAFEGQIPGCHASLQHANEGRYAIKVRGDDADDVNDPSLKQVLFTGFVGDPIPHKQMELESPIDDGFRVAEDVLLYANGSFEWVAYPWGSPDPLFIASPATDPEGFLLGQPALTGGTVFLTSAKSAHPGINVWDQAGGFRDFIKYPGDYTKGAGDLGTDGVDLVWDEGSGKQPGDTKFPVRDVWTAPFTSDPLVLQATKKRLRSHPPTPGPISASEWVVGCGYAAFGNNMQMMIVRLSDGVAWFLGDVSHQFQYPIGFTCDELFAFVKFANQPFTHVRIALSSLGPGMPPD